MPEGTRQEEARTATRSRPAGAHRDTSIQTLRGLAVVLLVAGHVYGLDSAVGLRIAGDTVGRHLTESLEYFRMPLFTVISGYVYALRPVRARGVPPFLAAKTRRLLLPLLPLTAIIGGLQILAGSESSFTPSVGDVLRGYVFGYSHLWFLQAIFLVFALVAVLDALGRLDTVRGWSIAWAAGVLAYVVIPVPPDYDVFSIGGALRLFPFFLLGYALVRHRDRVLTRPVVVALVVVLVVGHGVQQALMLNGVTVGLQSSGADVEFSGLPLRAFAVVVGTAGITCLFLVRHLITVPLLAWVGTYAFTIYLLHTIAAAGSRLLLGAAGVDSVAVLFPIGVVVAIALPVVFEKTFGRINAVRVVLLGEKPLRRPSPAAADESPALR
jgi:fucose 4-O-acetylase-like acetyltransferase